MLRAKRISERDLLKLPAKAPRIPMRIFIAVDGSKDADRVKESMTAAYDKSRHHIVDIIDDCERVLIVPTRGWGKSPAINEVFGIAKAQKKRVIIMGGKIEAIIGMADA